MKKGVKKPVTKGQATATATSLTFKRNAKKGSQRQNLKSSSCLSRGKHQEKLLNVTNDTSLIYQLKGQQGEAINATQRQANAVTNVNFENVQKSARRNMQSLCRPTKLQDSLIDALANI